MRLLVVGGSGLVGSNVVRLAERDDTAVLATHRTNDTATTDRRLDKTDADAVRTLIDEFDPDVVVDTAAFHAVDDCERRRRLAWKVNATGSRNVATAADAVGAHYVFVSSDYVFSGDPGEAPYVETDPVDPPNYYGRTKYAGETAAKIAETTTVLRSSVVYGLASDNFATWLLRELERGEVVDIVDDQVSAPTYAPDLARVCLTVADREMSGLYHAAGPERLDRYEFSLRLATACGYDPELVSPVATDQLGQRADRPADSSLDSTALYETTDDRFRPPSEALADLADRR